MKDPLFIPHSLVPSPLSAKATPTIPGDRSLCVFYEMPKSDIVHRSALLRGVKLDPPMLSRADLEIVKNKAQNSGRSYGGAPLYRSSSGRGHGRGSDFQGSYQSNRGTSRGYQGQNHTPSYGSGTWQPPPPPPGLSSWGGWGGQGNQPRASYTHPPPPYIPPGRYQQAGRYPPPPPPPPAPAAFSRGASFGRGQTQYPHSAGLYTHDQQHRDDRYRPSNTDDRHNDRYNDRHNDRGRGSSNGGYRGGRGGGNTNRGRGDSRDMWRR